MRCADRGVWAAPHHNTRSGAHANLCIHLSVSVGPPPTKSGNPSEHLGHPPLDVTSPIDATRPLLSLTCKRAPIRGRHLGLSVVSRNWIKSYFPPTSSRGHVHWSVPNLVRKHMLVHVPLRGPRQARPGMYHLRLLGVSCAARCGLGASYSIGPPAPTSCPGCALPAPAYLLGVGRALGVACADSDPPTSCDSNIAVAAHDNGGVESSLLRLLLPIPPGGEWPD